VPDTKFSREDTGVHIVVAVRGRGSGHRHVPTVRLLPRVPYVIPTIVTLSWNPRSSAVASCDTPPVVRDFDLCELSLVVVACS